MKRTALPLIALSLFVLPGCSSSPAKYTWDDNSSTALNITTAAGIRGLEDSELPEDVTEADLRVPGALVYGLSGFYAPTIGFSSLESAGLNFASMLFAPTPAAKRNSFFYWDHESTNKDEFYENFVKIFENAKAQYLASNPKYKIRSGYRSKEHEVLWTTVYPSWFMNLSGEGCITENNDWACSIGFNLKEIREAYYPDRKTTSMFTDVTHGGASYARFNVCYSRDDEDRAICSEYSRGKINTGFNEVEFLLEFSKYLPKDLYLYVAPKKLFMAKDTPNKVPFLIGNGNTHYFIKPRDTEISAHE